MQSLPNPLDVHLSSIVVYALRADADITVHCRVSEFVAYLHDPIHSEIMGIELRKYTLYNVIPRLSAKRE